MEDFDRKQFAHLATHRNVAPIVQLEGAHRRQIDVRRADIEERGAQLHVDVGRLAAEVGGEELVLCVEHDVDRRLVDADLLQYTV